MGCLTIELEGISRRAATCQSKPNETFVLRHNQQFAHIPKAGGSTVERFERSCTRSFGRQRLAIRVAAAERRPAVHESYAKVG